MPAQVKSPNRWADAFVAANGDFETFWREYLTDAQRKVCYIHAIGFDPRARAFLTDIGTAGCSRISNALTFEFQYRTQDPELEQRVTENRDAMNAALSSAKVLKEEVKIANPQHAGEVSRRTQTLVQRFIETDSAGATDIVVDINSMPKSIAMTAVATALRICDKEANRNRLNLHVIVYHDPELDHLIRQVDTFNDPFLHAEFLSGFDTEGAEILPAIWMPILGEGRISQVRAIGNAKWAPRDIYPVVPSPARDPRTGDRLILEYGPLLAESGPNANPLRNVLRVSEENPIEAYEEFINTIAEHGAAFKVLGGCRVLVSSHSTKLLSLAGLLAVYEARQRQLCRGASYAFVEGGGHRMDGESSSEARPYTLWLAGRPYAE